jgi:hypothetical protein
MKMKLRLLSLLLLMSLALFLPLNATDAKYRVIRLLNSGWVKGRVTHAKMNLEVPKLEVDRDPQVCGKESRSIQAVDIGSDGALRNAVVYLKSVAMGKAFNLPPNPPTLTQEHCDYQPHVQVVAPLSSIKILNNDSILHSIHAFQFPFGAKFVIYPNSISYPAHTLFNIAMVAQRKESYQQLNGPGIVKFVCDAGHYWMTAYAVVMSHPYFVKVDQDGSYSLEGVPPGKYTVVCWHEYFGTQEKEVVVRENQPAMADFQYTEEL